MQDLKVIGKEHIGKIEFTGIEGGFGKNKKAMLVKDIAQIHGRENREINELINRNINRFRNDIDLIDVLNRSERFRNLALENSWIGSNRTQHVYLLSERGYAKLLKILDDDKAWDIYDQLVDNYFNMRVAIKSNEPSLVQQRRLSIMEENAATRKANMLYKLAMATTSESSKQALIAKGAEVLTGEMEIPILKEKYYSAGEIAKELNISSKKVGMIANDLGLKAEQPGQNEYGRWATSKSQYSPKEVPVWLYTKKGMQTIKKEFKSNAK